MRISTINIIFNLIIMSIELQFEKAVFYIRNGQQTDSNNEKKLGYYKYYKQVTNGDVTGKQPWAVQLEARAKWDAWNSVKGLSSEKAMKKYIELLSNDNKDWESHNYQ